MYLDPTPCDQCGRLALGATDDTGAAPPVTPSGPVLSIVVPLLNEEEVLNTTYRRLKETLDGLGETYEILFVDDGSTDGSRGLLAAIAAHDPAVRVLALSRNFGHEMATTAGLHHARGQAAVVIDADLQDPPELIGEFVRKWREGYQVVYGVRRHREGETWLKKATSWFFYRLLGRIGDVRIPADTGDFRLMDRSVLDVYRQFQEEPRFFRGLVSWVGFKQIGVPFVRQPRAGGVTKYRYGRLLRLAFDTITAFSTKPAHYITLTAGALAGLSVVFSATVIGLWLAGSLAMQGWMWAALAFLALWNVQFVALAVLGEYIVRTHRHTQRRPLYVVETVIEGGRARSVPRPATPARLMEAVSTA
jgi:glycosyltransferase involved in cell wall biosynthesis